MPDLATIRFILPSQGSLEAVVARSRYQRPSVLARGDYWCIRPRLPRLDPATGTYARIQTWIQLGARASMTLTDAKKAADKYMATVNDGRFVATAQQDFSAIVEKYKSAELPNLGSATRDKYLSMIKNHILPTFGRLRLADIDIPAVKTWLNSKRAIDGKTGERLYSDNSIATMRNALSAIFSAAKEWGYWCGENPVAAVDVGDIEPVREKQLLTAEQVQAFLDEIRDTRICTADVARLITRTAIVSGLRVSEILGLQWRDLDAEGSLHVRRRARRGDVAKPKSKASKREDQIGPFAKELLALRRTGSQETEWVFSRDGAPLDDRDLQQHVFRPAAEAAKIYAPGFGMHWFRALNATLRQQFGATAIEAAKALGHASVAMTAHYTLRDKEREHGHVVSIADWMTKKAG